MGCIRAALRLTLRAMSDSRMATARERSQASARRSLPLRGFDLLANSAHDQIALQHAQMREEQPAVEVVGLMAKRARQQPFAGHRKLFSFGVLSPHRNA